ncbi:MAG: SIS domain-containing protein [Erythrobacter sp.]|uniref:D-sedoheptulose-7-phosphate isomerase n=1 Tax=Erythrobacter sp. TaxID=1042 RepID=UPI0032EDE6AB
MPYFPSSQIEHASTYADEYFERLAEASKTIDRNAVEEAARLIAETTHDGRRIYCCGNGGSAAISNHLVCDCVKGIRTDSTLRPQVVSLSSNIEIITAIGNDIGYDKIFRYQLESLAGAGDLLIVISSSGGSPNIVEAVEWARENGVASIAMTGFSGGQARELADISLHVEAENYGIIEDLHQSLMHLLAQYSRQKHICDTAKLGQLKF